MMSINSSEENEIQNNNTSNKKPEQPTLIQTPLFKISRTLLFRHLISHHAKIPLIIIATLTIASILTGILTDLRWIIVGLMCILIFLPAIAAWIYFDYGLRPSVAFNVIPHKILLTPQEIIILIPPLPSPDENNQSNTATNHQSLSYKKIIFQRNTLQQPILDLNGATIPIMTSLSGYLFIPYQITESNSGTIYFTDKIIHTLSSKS
ncbi:MAG: hypothetical protein NC201_03735 [Prevotella sp.]|nr:hypothetical protein [Bacteroides sp.]MCM1366340.1 hypothetical protein [Prevotella sp.]MCM1436302.1 hypothetical protein [Prevotella sp.]